MNSSGSKGNPKSGKPVNIRGSVIWKGDLRQIYDKFTTNYIWMSFVMISYGYAVAFLISAY